MLELNDIFLEKYRIDSVLGKGGMGQVYLGVHTTLDTKWAIKEIRKSKDINLLAEPEMLKRLNNPNIPRIIDVFETDEYLYIVEDFIEGKTLKKIWDEEKFIDENQVIKWSLELCDILIYLHSFKPNPIIYRDLKPENIMITEENKVKLVDFGIAREYKDYKTEDTQYLGSIGYADIEQIRNNGQSDARTDIFSLGVTMHQLLTGVDPTLNPYENEPVRKFNKDLSLGIEKIVSKCTQKHNEKRYNTVDELKDAILNVKYLTSDEYKKLRKKHLKVGSFIVLVLICSAIVTFAVLKENTNKKFKVSLEEGKFYLGQNDFNKAEVAYKDALVVKPKEVGVYEELCSLYEKKGAYKEIAKVIEDINQKGITMNDNLYLHYANSVYEQGNYKEAIEVYEKVLQINKDNINARLNEAICYARLNNKSRALGILNELKALKGDKINNGEVNYAEGAILNAGGEYASAEIKLKEALSENPKGVRILRELVNSLAKQNKDEQIEYLNKWLSISPNNTEAVNSIAMYNFNKGIKEEDVTKRNSYLNESIKNYKLLESLNGSSSELLYNLGTINFVLGNNDEAINLFNKSLELDSKNTSSMRKLATIYLSNKDYEKAKTYLDKIQGVVNEGEDFNYSVKMLKELKDKGWN